MTEPRHRWEEQPAAEEVFVEREMEREEKGKANARHDQFFNEAKPLARRPHSQKRTKGTPQTEHPSQGGRNEAAN